MPYHFKLPIGEEDDFKGVVDLIKKSRELFGMKKIMGMQHSKIIDIPEDIIDEARTNTRS